MKLSDAIDRYCKKTMTLKPVFFKTSRDILQKNDIGCLRKCLKMIKGYRNNYNRIKTLASMLAQRALSEYSKKHKVTSQIKEYSKALQILMAK